jgi:hypothetical protein
MKRMSLPFTTVLVAALLAVATMAQDKGGAMKGSSVPQTPEWQKLVGLVGSWEGTMQEAGQTMPATAEVRMTGDGSAIMHVLGPGGPFEMVTMIHPDGKRILATHYCAAHNQPRMALAPSDAPNKVAFTFVDGTNIGPGETYMKGVVFTFIDADHHEEAWSNSGSSAVGIFKFARKKH